MPIDIDFFDHYKISKPSQSQLSEFKDFQSAPDGKSLMITIEATHAALVNKNDKFYIPSRMADGTSTFQVQDKPTKLLKHHDLASDPVGVVRAARFVPTVPEDLIGNPDIVTLVSSTATMEDQIVAYQNLARSGIMDREDWRGLGYIELVGEVMDSETIQQIHDGRLDAVSTYFRSPGHVYCSICNQNLAQDGYCDHDRGQLYEDDNDDSVRVPALWIPGVHNYVETSFVVSDADPLTSIRVTDTVNQDNNQTICLSRDDWKEDPRAEGNTIFQFKDSVEEDTDMKITLSEAEQKVFDILKKFRDTEDEDELAKKAQTICALVGEDDLLPDQADAELDQETALLYALEDLETEDQEVNADEICEGMREELAKMKDEGLLTEEEFDSADAKLSSKARKKLNKSTFCGPDRSFPVPDCAHVTAARRLIGRYKGPGNKSNILACVGRKAKALGCGDSKDNKDTNDGKVDLLPCAEDGLKDMTDEQLRNMFHITELALVERKLTVKRDCSDCATHVAETKAARDELGKLRDEMKDKEDQLTALRYELRKAFVDFEQQLDQSVEATVLARTERTKRLSLMGVLTQKHDSLEAAADALKSADLEVEELTFKDSFDLKAMVEKLHDGTTRTPSGTVEDPTINIDKDNDQLPEGLTKAAEAALDNIKDYIESGQIGKAKRLYDRMVAMDEFPDDMTFESLSADNPEAAE